MAQQVFSKSTLEEELAVTEAMEVMELRVPLELTVQMPQNTDVERMEVQEVPEVMVEMPQVEPLAEMEASLKL